MTNRNMNNNTPKRFPSVLESKESKKEANKSIRSRSIFKKSIRENEANLEVEFRYPNTTIYKDADIRIYQPSKFNKRRRDPRVKRDPQGEAISKLFQSPDVEGAIHERLCTWPEGNEIIHLAMYLQSKQSCANYVKPSVLPKKESLPQISLSRASGLTFDRNSPPKLPPMKRLPSKPRLSKDTVKPTTWKAINKDVVSTVNWLNRVSELKGINDNAPK